MTRSCRRHGFFLIDSVAAVGLIVVIAAIVWTGITRQQRAANIMADRRYAMRAAEQVLIDMQAGRTAPALQPDQTVRIDSDNAPASPGLVWVTVTVNRHQQQVKLTGLVPDNVAALALSQTREVAP